jgi:hypothetical protein
VVHELEELLLEDSPLKSRKRKKPTETNISSHRSFAQQWTADQCRDLVKMEERFLDYDYTKQHVIVRSGDVRLGSEPSGVNLIAGNMGNARDHALNTVTKPPEVRVVDDTRESNIKLDELKYY